MTKLTPDQLAKHAGGAADEGSKLPPVHLWNPDFCGEIDIRIARNGDWFHEGSVIARPAMVRLFSTILRRDDDNEFYLVTPVEKLRIQVDCAPFLITQMDVSGDGRSCELRFKTNVGDTVIASQEHPVIVETDPVTGHPSPRIRVRDRLDALISRSVYYSLVDLAEERKGAEGTELGVWSCGHFFSLGYC